MYIIIIKCMQWSQERYAAMADKPFLYGSHYSAPGYVLFYLVRQGMMCRVNLLHFTIIATSTFAL